ncbi:3-phosphoserine/phosphohydroxythreonine transaminase [Ramlibacter sp.]|uniref:3-phosphoserine/phosphohydroxythreonine transaminase n=1 Tax=Ramlibacter sp. TaxID=1917967 RepID=UPI002D0E58EF|nr:3-phosphoserine/phosphohydroxythreonine transaminase [Ramlibacter sp.]HWI81266.1 3-phosphoserine/phosphohydroxythreonine transaminase [Ramlibacter sp.]
MTRVFNFSSGPAALPEPVLRQAAQEMLDWQGSGMSVMEMSHRGKEFMSIHAEAQALLRELLGIPANYKVLFMQGGAIGENAIVPMNLIGRTGQADYVVTGDWSRKSMKEAQRYGKVLVAATGDGSEIPPQSAWTLDPRSSYVHICSNETIGGVEFHWTPDTGAVPLVADMSSNILSRRIDVSRYGLIYGGAQKNMGPSGLTVVIVRDDLLGHALATTPSAFNYQIQAENDSMFNTPPTYAIYIAGLVFKWLKAQGGLAAIEQHNARKAALLYDYLDRSSFYRNTVAREDRSLMNVPFRLRDEALDASFLEGAQQRGMVQLKGHRSVGGMRASIYNAMPLEGVQALVAYMQEFEARHG